VSRSRLGRNDPCWCGSGRKYKKCHLNRSSEKDVPFEGIVREMQAAWDHKQCSHPQAAPGVCNRIVSAHTIQRSRVLKQIVDSSNHVCSFHPLKPNFEEKRFEVRRVGWKEASTFTGFCGKHDNATFRPLEEAEFIGSAEQCFLLGYRALCHGVYQKTGLVRSYPTIRDLVDRGLPPPYQRELQAFWANHLAGATRGLEDFGKLKKAMDEHLLRNDYTGWRNVVIRFRGEICVASIGAISPNKDFEGKPLQTLHDLEDEIEELMFGIVATSDGGAGVFTWRDCDPAPRVFVESMLANDRARLPHLLLQFTFAYIENTYFSGTWWSSLSPADQLHIEKLAGMGNPYYTNFRYSPSLSLVPWEITDIAVS
jgi:SEC-C motif